MTENPVVKVMLMRHITEEQFKGTDIPARSKLYGLVPCGLGTVWQESLTSYLNRLAWRHHTPPRHLAAQELLPRLSQNYSRRQLVGQLAIEYPLTRAAPDPPKRRKRARSRRCRRLPFHTKDVGLVFHPFTVCSNQSMTS
jgi:hypothetical protein